MSASFKDSRTPGRFDARAEDELLLLCARPRVGEEEAARIRSLADRTTDWYYLFRLARRHAVLPLLHRGIFAHARDSAPQAFLQKLGDGFRRNATRNLLLAGELMRVARLFESEGVRALAYKGPALAVSAYGDLSLRRFVDLDVVVNRGDVRRAGGLLRSLGFDSQKGLTEAHERILLRGQHNLAYARDAGRLTVELHWELAPRGYARLPLDETVWARAERVSLCGGEVSTLSPEDLLPALCVHGTKHLWERLSWVGDVAALLNSRPNLDFVYALEKSREAGAERMLLLGLRLAGTLLGAEMPPGLNARAESDAAVEKLCASVVEKLFKGERLEPSGLVGSVGFNLKSRRLLREKARYFRFILTPTDGDLTAFSLPGKLSFVYYLLRPLRLALKGGGG